MIIKEVNCMVRNSIPLEGETIATDFDLKKLIPKINSVKVYLRNEVDCPFGRGNWMIDIQFSNDQPFAIKLPASMTKEDILAYVKPLKNALQN